MALATRLAFDDDAISADSPERFETFSMARFNPHRDSAPILSAARLWADRCLTGDGSVFLENEGFWTLEHLDELDRAFVQNLDESDARFLEKLNRQLQTVSPAARRLMAEAMWLLMLFQSNVSPEKKRENIRTIWGWSGAELNEHHPLLADLVLAGIGSPGTAYNTHRWRELSYLISLARSFKRLDISQRSDALSEAWRFSRWLDEVPRDGQRQLRHILRYLCFPDEFERISVGKDKRAILVAFTSIPARELSGWNDERTDRALLNLRQKLEAERGSHELDFYVGDLREPWQPKPPTRSWLLSWNPERWEWTSLAEDRRRTAAGETADQRWRCASRQAKEGDRVFLMRTGVAPKGVVARGTVVKAPYEAPHYNPAKAEAGATTWVIDAGFTAVRDATRDTIIPLDELERTQPRQAWNPQASGIAIEPEAAELLSTLWDRLPLVRLEESERAATAAEAAVRPAVNLILYGPPGTGKTHRLRSAFLPAYEQKSADVDQDAWIAANVQDLQWWQVAFLVLYDLARPASVSDVLEHPLFKAKARLSDNQNVRATCWNALQYHTPPSSQHVQVDITRRSEPYIFDKGDDGRWRLVGDWQDSCASLVERVERIRGGPRSGEAPIRRYEFVTFHQSYSYEDFVEGIRPQVGNDGAISYEVKHGVLRRLCARAKVDPSHRYALFIDEVNRANVAKVFGELITLLEPDKRATYDADGHLISGLEVTLPYSGKPFGVPANLDVYGTMNTADRSIALLDAALRRRFEFEELMPTPAAIAGMSGGLIPDGEGGEVDLRQLLDALNQRLAHLLHRDQTIGHSYLMRVKDFPALQRVVAREILPLLQEYFYEDWRRIRLVLADHVAPAEHQIIRRHTVAARDLFGTDDDLADAEQYSVVPELEITPDAVRKIYEPLRE